MKYKVVDWTNSHPWLVAVTGKDGSYTPLLELKPTKRPTEPVYLNQVYQAARLLENDGLKALDNPHAATGRICRCGDCFCCAALTVSRIAHRLEDKSEVA